MPRLIDVSPTISPRIGVWPGDVPFSQEYAARIADGANLDLSSIRTTLHLGAHADAPSHYAADGDGIAARALDLYYGDCEVVAVEVARGARVMPEDLPGPVSAPRVLIRTGTFPDAEDWNEDFAGLSPQLVEHLVAQGVRLIGIDTPSVDPQEDEALESHQAMARHDVANLEGLVLDHVAPGRYVLIALPLKIEGADAGPVRAALLAPD